MNHLLPAGLLLVNFTLAVACTTAAVSVSDANAGETAEVNGQSEEAPATPAAPPAVEGHAEQDAEHWLDRIEARADDIDTLHAQVRYERVQMLLGDEQTRFGHLTYDAGPPARFHVHFDRLAMHGELQMQERRYIFDGRWLAERQDDQRLFIRRELVAEEEVGQDLLRLGEGPFALPLDLEKETVLERFAVTLVESDEPEVENSVQLRLIPLPNVQIEQTRIDMWYDRDSLLPVQVRTVNEEDQTESTIRLREVETGMEVDDAVFSTQPPQEAGWQVEVRELD